MTDPTDDDNARGQGELMLYRTEDGRDTFQLRVEDGSVWMTQAEIAALFENTPQNVTQHLKVVYDEGELSVESTCKDFLQVRQEGGRQVKRTTKLYNLQAILAVGYRVRSERGTQFRRWATTTLNEYLIKGFVMDDERLKQPGGFDYFDELLERIRDIRTSEKRFYQKVRDLFALTSADYNAKTASASLFFKTIQNKMVFAATGQTAAELIVARADPARPNMALTAWKGERVRKGDVTTSKNYLTGRNRHAQPAGGRVPGVRRVARQEPAIHHDGRLGGADRPRPDVQRTRGPEGAGQSVQRADGNHRPRTLRCVRCGAPERRNRGLRARSRC
jgi:hypothetical protein